MPSLSKSPHRRELGQFLTPPHIADYMASFFSIPRREWRILDPGAGKGSLTAALVTKICTSVEPPLSVHISAYEIDKDLLPALEQSLDELRSVCMARGIVFDATIYPEDFIDAVAGSLAKQLFEPSLNRFNAAILDPPYRKVNSSSKTRRSLRSVGIETSNLYTGFLALATKLLSDGGELVSITPRSFAMDHISNRSEGSFSKM